VSIRTSDRNARAKFAQAALSIEAKAKAWLIARTPELIRGYRFSDGVDAHYAEHGGDGGDE